VSTIWPEVRTTGLPKLGTPLRVAYSATVWDGGHSGIGTYLREHLREINRRPDEFKLSVLEDGGKFLDGSAPPTRTSTGSGTSRIAGPVRDIVWHRQHCQIGVRAHHVEVLHSPTIRRIPRVAGIPVTITVHDTAPIRYPEKYGALRSIYHRRILGRWLEEVDAIVTPSQSTADDVCDHYGVNAERVRVVPNGIDHDLFTASKSEDQIKTERAHLEKAYGITRRFIVFVARLEHPSKNHVRLIEAYQQLLDESSNPEEVPDLVFVGSEWNGSEHIEAAAVDLVEKGRLHITGRVPTIDLPRFYRVADLAVYPSLFEGFGLPVVEAMACGTAVACSNGSSLGEIAGDNALTFDPENTEEIAQSLHSLSNTKSARDKLAKAGLSHARAFTWERSVSETAEVWHQVAR